MDAKVSIKTKTKTMPVQNLFRYISFKTYNTYNRKDSVFKIKEITTIFFEKLKKFRAKKKSTEITRSKNYWGSSRILKEFALFLTYCAKEEKNMNNNKATSRQKFFASNTCADQNRVH